MYIVKGEKINLSFDALLFSLVRSDENLSHYDLFLKIFDEKKKTSDDYLSANTPVAHPVSRDAVSMSVHRYVGRANEPSFTWDYVNTDRPRENNRTENNRMIYRS